MASAGPLAHRWLRRAISPIDGFLGPLGHRWVPHGMAHRPTILAVLIWRLDGRAATALQRKSMLRGTIAFVARRNIMPKIYHASNLGSPNSRAILVDPSYLGWDLWM